MIGPWKEPVDGSAIRHAKATIAEGMPCPSPHLRPSDAPVGNLDGPFVATFWRQEPSAHAPPSVRGLLSDVERKNVASIAYRFGQDRLPLQRFIDWAE
jgi:hypothetical protein